MASQYGDTPFFGDAKSWSASLPNSLQNRQGVSWYQRWMERHLTLSNADQIESAYLLAIEQLEQVRILTRINNERDGEMILIRPESLLIWNDPIQLLSDQVQYWLNVPNQLREKLLGMPCLDGDASYQLVRSRSEAQEQRLLRSELGRIYAAEHTGLLERKPREISRIASRRGIAKLGTRTCFLPHPPRDGS